MEIASIVTASVLSQWCNESLVVVFDVVMGSTVFVCALIAMTIAILQHEARIDVVSMFDFCWRGAMFGGILWVGIALLLVVLGCFFVLQIAAIISAVLALQSEVCGSWDLPWPLVIASSFSLITMMMMLFLIAVDLCFKEGRSWTCNNKARNTLILSPFFLLSVRQLVASAHW